MNSETGLRRRPSLVVAEILALAEQLSAIECFALPGEELAVPLDVNTMSASTGSVAIHDWLQFNKSAEFARTFRLRIDELQNLADSETPLEFHLGRELLVQYLEELALALESMSADGEEVDAAKPDPIENMSAEARALAIMVDHPEWSDTQIAEAVGVSRTTLYDWPKFKAAKKAARVKRPRGQKSRDGTIEAEAE